MSGAPTIPRVKAAVAAVTDNKAEIDVKVCQLVRLFRDGEPFRMSKRAGDFITLRDVVEEVGKDAVRFMMLTRKNDASLDFDFAKVMEQSRDNPVFYVQYAHARIASVLRNAAEQGFDLSETSLSAANLSLFILSDKPDVTMARLALIRAAAFVLAAGLGVLGVEPAEEMR